ncbi:MAG: hypothetical protein ACK5MV_07635 [Aminipila sp.]
MDNLNFDSGMMELAINGDESKVLRINPADEKIVEGLLKIVESKEIKEFIENEKALFDKSNKDSNLEKVKKKNQLNLELDKFLRNELDLILGVGISELVFGDICVTAINSNGEIIFSSFVNALLNMIKSEILKRSAKTQEIIKKYKPR